METVVLRARLLQQHDSATRIAMMSEELDVRSPARIQFVMDFETWIAQYVSRAATDRRSHEVYHEDLPCKLFFDLESGETSTQNQTRMEEAVAELRRFVAARYQTQKCVDLTSTRHDKLSRHLIFPDVVFPKMRDIRAVVAEIQTKCLCATEFMDVGVYHKRSGTLRVAWSTGFGKNTWLVPNGQNPRAPGAVAVHILRDSLVTYVDASKMSAALLAWVPRGGWGEEEAEYHGTRKFTNSPRPPEKEKEWKELGWTITELETLTRAVGEMLVEGGGCNASHFPSANDELAVAVGGLPCAVAGRTHHSNRLVVTFKLPFRTHAAMFGPLWVRVRCLDEECRHSEWSDARIETSIRTVFFASI